MRYHLTASLITALFLSSCGDAPQTDAEPSSTSDISHSEISTPELSRTESSKTESSKTEISKSKISTDDRAANAAAIPAAKKSPSTGSVPFYAGHVGGIANRFEGLDPKEISQAEIDELIALEKEQTELHEQYRKDMMAWQRQDAMNRGERPQMQSSQRSQIVMERTQELNSKVHIAGLRKHYRTLDPDIISQADIDELIDLQRVQSQQNLELQKKMTAWSAQDPATRGEYPRVDMQPRLQELNSRVQMASLRKQYEDLDPQFISKGEIDELILLQQDQMKMQLEIQTKFQAWSNQDPATRGPQPELNLPQIETNFRLQELQMKVSSAHQAKSLRARVEKLSQTHNISLSDGEMTQLAALQIEQQKLRAEYQKTMMKWSQE